MGFVVGLVNLSHGYLASNFIYIVGDGYITKKKKRGKATIRWKHISKLLFLLHASCKIKSIWR